MSLPRTRARLRHTGGPARRLRRATLAAVAAGSLVLAACGSDDDSDSSADSSAAGTAHSSATASHGAGSSAAATSGAPTSGSEKPGDPSEPGRPGDPGHPGADPQHPDGGDGARPDGGAPAPAADGDDAAAITAVVRGMADQRSQADFDQYTLDNYCAAYIDSRGGRDALQGEVDRTRADDHDVNAQITVDSVDDIRVDGDHATAVTNGTVNGQPSSSPATYQREDGAWKICPTA
jgi:hypothetical protein